MTIRFAPGRMPGLRAKRLRQYCRRFFLFVLAMGYVLGWPTQLDAATAAEASLNNRATYTYTDSSSQQEFAGNSAVLSLDGLIDPFGRVLGCGGGALPDYTNFSIGLYSLNPADPTQSELGNLVSLTPTEFPDIPNNGIARGVSPNSQNSNPFTLSNASQGAYNFLLDPNRGQTSVGQTYVLVVMPPPTSSYGQRRIKLEITSNTGGAQAVVTYRATSLDGQPIALSGATQVTQQVVQVNNAEQVGLQFFALQLSPMLCNAQQVQITKSGDRAVAQPGDTVIYRVVVRNQTDAPLNNLSISDALPMGFRLLPQSVRSEIAGQLYPVQVTQSGANPVFQLDPATVLPVKGTLSLVYAVQLTPDAIRGTGRNSATVAALRTDTGQPVRDGPATYLLRIDSGLMSDCGTLIGRVFIDKNFDGEQQPGEPGVPHAVILLDDGNRITTDTDGLFSLANVLPGYRTGVLDPLSIPNLQLAPNHYLAERNTDSRLVHLAPGGMVRMNFAVTPSTTEVNGP
ncbi:MAG TPA: hypothetical protein V6D29_09370 [Leptolyngbyaceae cyanobacterium]